jgi:hypothetical protein
MCLHAVQENFKGLIDALHDTKGPCDNNSVSFSINLLQNPEIILLEKFSSCRQLWGSHYLGRKVW